MNTNIFFQPYTEVGAWGGVVVKALGTVPGLIPGHWGFFPGHQTVPCALGPTQPLKMSKDGRCVRVATLPPSCAECLKILEP